jgi:hypothetical protein
MSDDQASPTGPGKQGGPPPPKNDGAHGSKPVKPAEPAPHPVAGNPSVPAAPPDGVDPPDADKPTEGGSA